ncbi:VWA domain-containing protein [Anatilimnocola sp. NA78]|uniref:VWA domain-containing protein n=1 Tax=Anatilimnocola sp. NA78 TaxID=3415683 RepID=UPI003CE50D93
MKRLLLLVAACGLALAFTAKPAWTDEVGAAFTAAKSKLLQDLRSGNIDIRAAAVNKFREFPTPEAASTLLLQGSITRFPDVRRGCFDVVRTFRNSEEVGRTFLADILRELKLDKVEPTTAVRTLVLLEGDDPAVQKLAERVVEQAEKSPAGILLLALVIDQLGEAADAASFQSLQRMAELPAASSHAGLKRALVQAFCKFDEKAAIAKLVEYHALAEGETRADIERRLLQVSGLKPEERHEWATWWQENEAKFVFPAEKKPEVGLFAKAASPANVPAYYGLPLYGTKIVFIIDYSGSMRGGKLDAAKRELNTAVNNLPDGVRFNIVAFNSAVVPWKRELVPVSPAAKQEASDFIYSGTATARTASYDALVSGLAQDCDAIYFLTDGAPNGGKIDDPRQILTIIGRQNRVRRATINALGIGVGAQGGTFDVFLRDLAAQNFGVYRRVD